MRSRILVLCLFAVTIFTPAAFATDRFDYERTQGIWLVAGPTFYVYARFPGFLDFRELIASKMATASEVERELPQPLYTLRLVGIREQTTLYVGESWIGDGQRAAKLDEHEFEWIQSSFSGRGEGSPIARLESSIRWVVNSQKDTAWEPSP